MKVSILTPAKYPELLASIDKPPTKLYVAGSLPDAPMVAIVGSRRPTEYGRSVTYKLAYDLAKAGVAIVSGLAIGLDGVAHEAALEAGGATIAVLPSGLSQIYPSGHKRLAKRILESGGALVSEYEPGEKARNYTFVERNRIISGLSQAVVVTEAAAASGTLLTANFALNQNRLVMAVPGNITSLYSAGPNNLIRSGAMPVTSSADVLAALDIIPAKSATSASHNKTEAEILEQLAKNKNIEQIIEGLNLPAQEVAVALSILEISGKIRNLGNGAWVIR